MRSSLSQQVRRTQSKARNVDLSLHPVLSTRRPFHVAQSFRATALPITATGPPPNPPVPAPEYDERIERRRRQAELLRQGQEIRASQKEGKSSPLRKRFWNAVHVKETPEGYQILLDSRPVRTPNKSILSIPLSKPQLAHAIAIEWDLMVSAQQALKNHNVPLTSMAARAQDILDTEAKGETKLRDDIINTMMKYLDTDTLLCWAPEQSPHDPLNTMERHKEQGSDSLRAIQVRTAQPIITHLTTTVWPGVEIKPVLDENSIMPNKQSELTRNVIRGWITGLPAYELAGLERAVLAGKSLLVGTRLLIEWSEHFRDLQKNASESESRFGIEEAVEASTLEVKWQTDMWGEVEDTHDVDKEDMRRQLGSAVLLVSGVR